MNIRTIFAKRKDVYPIIEHKRLLAFNRYGILSKRQLSSACLLSLSRWSTTHGRLSLESTLFSHKSCFTKAGPGCPGLFKPGRNDRSLFGTWVVGVKHVFVHLSSFS